MTNEQPEPSTEIDFRPPQGTLDDDHIWERREQESSLNFLAFCEYRDLGVRRTVRRAAAQFYTRHQQEDDPEGGRSGVAIFKDWAMKHAWTTRAEAYDIWLEAELRANAHQALRDMRERHAAVAQMAVEKAADRLAIAETDEIALGDAIKLLKEAAAIERVARGDADRVTLEGVAGGEPISIAPAISADGLEARIQAILSERRQAEAIEVTE